MAGRLPKEIKEMNLNWVNVDDVVSVTAYSRKMIKQLEKIYEQHPDEVEIINVNDDGTWYAYIPRKYVHVSICDRSRSKREMSDEQKAAVADRLKKAREEKAKEKRRINE